MTGRLGPEVAVRLLRAKAAELTARFEQVVVGAGTDPDYGYVIADLALLYELTADLAERLPVTQPSRPGRPAQTEGG